MRFHTRRVPSDYLYVFVNKAINKILGKVPANSLYRVSVTFFTITAVTINSQTTDKIVFWLTTIKDIRNWKNYFEENVNKYKN